jgi:hypothetical protein
MRGIRWGDVARRPSRRLRCAEPLISQGFPACSPPDARHSSAGHHHFPLMSLVRLSGMVSAPAGLARLPRSGRRLPPPTFPQVPRDPSGARTLSRRRCVSSISRVLRRCFRTRLEFPVFCRIDWVLKQRLTSGFSCSATKNGVSFAFTGSPAEGGSGLSGQESRATLGTAR